MQPNVTDAGLHFACLNASKTAASILARSVAYHVQEAKQEADVAEASEYKDEIKADIKAWAFAVRCCTERHRSRNHNLLFSAPLQAIKAAHLFSSRAACQL